MKLNILHITPDFNYACGRSYYVYLLLKYFNLDHNVFLITNGGDSLGRLDGLNIPCYLIKSLKSKNPVSFVKNINEISKFINENKINIVHTHHRYSELMATQAKHYYENTKTAAVFTALSLVNKKYNIEYRSDRIIAVSNTVKEMLIKKFNVNESKISLIHNFADTSEMDESTSLKKEPSKYYNILGVGRFHREKNFKLLLKALRRLGSKFKLTLVGEGDEEADFKKYINRNKLNAKIIKPRKNLAQFYRDADVCVLPSVKDPFPNFMLQAGLFSKPFIGSNVDGIGELIEDGRNGLLFESGNELELVDKIKTIKNEPSAAAKYGENLHYDVIKNYTQRNIIPEIQKLYYDVLKV